MNVKVRVKVLRLKIFSSVKINFLCCNSKNGLQFPNFSVSTIRVKDLKLPNYFRLFIPRHLRYLPTKVFGSGQPQNIFPTTRPRFYHICYMKISWIIHNPYPGLGISTSLSLINVCLGCFAVHETQSERYSKSTETFLCACKTQVSLQKYLKRFG